MNNLKCPNAECPCSRNGREARITTHGFYRMRSGKRRRYLCRSCSTRFSSTKGTAYYRLQHRRALFDEVASLSVEGVNKSAISRVKGIGWNTVHRWLERAGERCLRFNEKSLDGFELKEFQTDEIRAFVGGKGEVIWIFAGIEVGTRLCPSTVVGRRSSRNTLELLRDVLDRSVSPEKPLIVTDGFEFYGRVVEEVFGGSNPYRMNVAESGNLYFRVMSKNGPEGSFSTAARIEWSREGLVIRWDGAGVLEGASKLSGPYFPIQGAVSPYQVPQPWGHFQFYRIGQP